MRNMTRLIAVLLLVCTLFTGCSIGGDKEFTCEDLTITLPSYYKDLSDVSYASGVDFLYGFNEIGIMGIRETKESLESYGLELTLEDYAALIIDGNGLTCELTEVGGVKTFVYEADSEGQNYTYLSGVYENDEAFWVVQAYCLTSDYNKNYEELVKFLTSVVV